MIIQDAKFIANKLMKYLSTKRVIYGNPWKIPYRTFHDKIIVAEILMLTQ